MVTTTSRRLSGDTATYTCKSGFELLDLTPGSNMSTCQPNGIWTLPEPMCVGKCLAVNTLGGIIILTTYIAPLKVTVSTDSNPTRNIGDNFTLTCIVAGGEYNATTTYQWHRNNLPLSGETSATLSFTPLRQTTPSSNGQYVCEAMRSGRGCRSARVPISVTSKWF